MDTVVTIGGLDGPGLHVVTVLSHVAVDRNDRFLIGEARLAEFSVFDSTGRFLRTVGRRGEGPGEYRSIRHIGVGPQYIHVFDGNVGRTMLDHDFAVVRTDRFPGSVTSTVVKSDDGVVFAGEVPTAESVGHQLHVLGPSGELLSYGYGGGVYPPAFGMRMSSLSSVVVGNDDTLWLLPDRTNRLVRWDLEPEPRVGKVLDRSVAEFDADSTRRNNAGMLNDRGLWITWHTQDPRWTGTMGPEFPTDPPRKWLDGWLDLVDPTTGRTLARHHQDGVFLHSVAGAGYLVAYHETDAGIPFLHILEPGLSRGSEGRKP